ncbi:unnamed protein product [marine sediment metagenome]|uniref:Uncharacterized protein n=1 Tax=marine sediment metagenome TaxID=412755 RepID=X1VLD8_9ZZZZ
MFRIELIDIGGDGLVMGFDTSVDTLTEAEVIAVGEISGHVGTNEVKLYHSGDLIYDVFARGENVGSVAIKVL